MPPKSIDLGSGGRRRFLIRKYKFLRFYAVEHGSKNEFVVEIPQTIKKTAHNRTKVSRFFRFTLNFLRDVFRPKGVLASG